MINIERMKKRKPYIVDSVYRRGYKDGLVHGSCPYGTEGNREIWQMGYDDARGDREIAHQELADQADV